MSVGEYEDEPVRGLPEYLPAGETLVWQGEPDFSTLARRVFHVRSVSIYFAALIAIHVGLQFRDGATGLAQILLGSGWMLGLGVVALLILATLAWAYARSTVFTLTNKRLVLRFGVAMPMMVNIPLSIIEAADMREFGDGCGDVVLSLAPSKRLSYMMMWPNVRPWKFNPTQPALRSVKDVRGVAEALASVAQGAKPSVTASESNRDTLATGQMLGA